jgi:DNA-binding transcriptional MerR regulator/methylmalonyl-CoA mutase cobalamin-binding subunit
MSTEQGHTMKVVVRRTGLNPHVIRVWEKRYGAVVPSRTPTQRRLYTDAEIQRLILLRQATLAGHSIGQIARLSNERLRELIDADITAAPAPASHPASSTRSHSAGSPAPSHLDACLAAVEQLDATALETALMRARIALSHIVFMEILIIPLMHRIGELWHEGTLRNMHEHLTSAVVRTLLGGLVHTAGLPPTAPHLIVTTPAGQWHEIGALIVASIASADGWQVTYLGPNLPAEDIAAAAQQHHAKAVCLSLVYPPDDPHLPQELVRLRQYLSPNIAVFIGGRATAGYRDILQRIEAVLPSSLAEFRVQMEIVRTAGAGRAREVT